MNNLLLVAANIYLRILAKPVKTTTNSKQLQYTIKTKVIRDANSDDTVSININCRKPKMHAYEWTSANVFLWATPNFTTYESDTQLCTVTHYVHTYIHAYIHTYIHTCTYHGHKIYFAK